MPTKTALTNYATSSKYTRCFYSSQSYTGVFPTVTVTYTPTIQDGTYYIRNSATETYMKKGGTTEGSSVLTDSFDVDESKWIVTLQSTGYYTIKSASCDLYLGIAAGDSTGTSSVRLNDTTGRSSQWAILPMANGNYVLMANPVASNSNGVITRVLGVTETDSTVGQYAYTTGVNMHIQWQLITPQYAVNIQVLADHAYEERYSNYTDRIGNIMQTTQEWYLSNFGIYLNYSTPTLFKSLGDECDTKYGVACAHGSCQDSELYDHGLDYSNDKVVFNDQKEHHHKNFYNIFARIPWPNLGEAAGIAFIGHETCTVAMHGGSSNGLNGLCFSNDTGSVDFVMINNHDSLNDEIKTTIHEIGHWYDAPDHYNIGNIPSTTEKNNELNTTIFSPDCIYGENKEQESVVANRIICEGCRQIIYENRARIDD